MVSCSVENHTLRSLCEKHGTDKTKYADTYENLFREYVNLPVDIFEAGIWMGGSIRVWLDYFPSSRVYAIDNNSLFPLNNMPGKAVEDFVHDIDTTRFKYEIIDEYDSDKLRLFLSGRTFDIVIDDGSHDPQTQLQLYKTMIGSVKHGGLYIVEDIPCHVTDIGEWWGYPVVCELMKDHEGSAEQVGVFRR
jgi:hypothetical protein